MTSAAGIQFGFIAPPAVRPAGQASGTGSFPWAPLLILGGIAAFGWFIYGSQAQEEKRIERRIRDKRPFGYVTHVPPPPIHSGHYH